MTPNLVGAVLFGIIISIILIVGALLNRKSRHHKSVFQFLFEQTKKGAILPTHAVQALRHWQTIEDRDIAYLPIPTMVVQPGSSGPGSSGPKVQFVWNSPRYYLELQVSPTGLVERDFRDKEDPIFFEQVGQYDEIPIDFFDRLRKVAFETWRIR